MNIGREIRRDYRNLPPDILCDGEFIADILERAALAANAKIINVAYQSLGGNGSPPGCTCALLLDESHITAHSYAAKGMLAINVFTCGTNAAPLIAIEFIERELEEYGKPVVIFADDIPRFRTEQDGKTTRS